MHKPTLWIDLETYCDVPLKEGLHKYAESVEITLFAYTIDDCAIEVLDFTDPDTDKAQLHALLDRAAKGELVIKAQNSHFDRTVMRHVMPRHTPDIEHWGDTMIQAYAHSLPGALDKMGDVYGLSEAQAKDKEGRTLVLLFCKPRPKNSKIRRATRETHPVEWAKFITYAGRDIEAMRTLSKKMPTWNIGPEETALWHLDQKINDRGVLIDTELASSALEAVDRAQKILALRTQELTNDEVQAATQRDEMLKHILKEYGVDLPDMQKATLEKRIDDQSLPQGLRELLAVRLQSSTTSTAKYKTLIKGVSADGRLRGLLQFDGASRTGRWSGRLFQPQNLPRPTYSNEDIELGIESMKNGCEDLIFDNVMSLASSAIRGTIIAPQGKKLVVSDLSNIEGRDQAWLAGEQWKIKAFRDFDAGNGPDMYKLAYSKSFGISPADVTKQQRQIGKVQELALGYGGGVGAFTTFALAYNIDLNDMADQAYDAIPVDVLKDSQDTYDWMKRQKRSTFGMRAKTWVVCEAFKKSWRAAHPNIVETWQDLENACIMAIQRPNTPTYVNALIVDCVGKWLRIRLPSGRYLCYPSPRLVNGGITYMGTNQYSRQWARLTTYGGKLFENVCQAVARDVMAANMQAAEDNGYEIVLTVHDELITEAPDSDNYSAESLSEILATVPRWAKGLPLAASGFETHRYRKDD